MGFFKDIGNFFEEAVPFVFPTQIPFIKGKKFIENITGKSGSDANRRALDDDSIAARNAARLNANSALQDAANTREVAALNKKAALNDALVVNDIAEFNASVFEADAKASEDAGRIRAEQQNRADQRIIGEQITRYAASGVTMSGSALNILNESERTAKENINNIMFTAKIQANRARSTARLTRIMGVAQQEKIRTEVDIMETVSENAAKSFETEADIILEVGADRARRFLQQSDITRITQREELFRLPIDIATKALPFLL